MCLPLQTAQAALPGRSAVLSFDQKAPLGVLIRAGGPTSPCPQHWRVGVTKLRAFRDLPQFP